MIFKKEEILQQMIEVKRELLANNPLGISLNFIYDAISQISNSESDSLNLTHIMCSFMNGFAEGALQLKTPFASSNLLDKSGELK